MNREDENNHDEADRGMPSINGGPKPRGLGRKLVLVAGVILTILSLVAVNGGFANKEEVEKAPAKTRIGNQLGPAPKLPAPPVPPKAPPPTPSAEKGTIRTGQAPPPKPPRYIGHRGHEKKERTPDERKRESELLAFGSRGKSAGSLPATPQVVDADGNAVVWNGKAERADGLGAKLEPTIVEGARAGLIADRNMFITRGTFLDAALETAISSDVPGMTSCRITRDIYSTSGKVLLLERGSRITGQYKGGLKRGKARIFVLWTRVETPSGVIINLDSPGTGPLGRAGHDGYIDNHFWARFGGAILLSLVDDVGTYIAGELSDSGSGNNQIQFGSTTDTAQDAASIALEHSIDIPPTLGKNQGDHISVFVARDLDFRGVYELRASN